MLRSPTTIGLPGTTWFLSRTGPRGLPEGLFPAGVPTGVCPLPLGTNANGTPLVELEII